MADGKIAIVDYGVGNLFNVQRALERVGGTSEILSHAKSILRADKLLLPGVGSFEAGIGSLRKEGLEGVVRDFQKTGKPVLGICLGMQLLMTESEENGVHRGLGIIPGRVVRLLPSVASEPRFKIPQIAWNGLELPEHRKKGWRGTLLAGLPEGADMYFVHSYCVKVDDEKDNLAVTRYGRDVFTSVLQRDNVAGCQFHPERSGEMGLKLLKNFVMS